MVGDRWLSGYDDGESTTQKGIVDGDERKRKTGKEIKKEKEERGKRGDVDERKRKTGKEIKKE